VGLAEGVHVDALHSPLPLALDLGGDRHGPLLQLGASGARVVGDHVGVPRLLGHGAAQEGAVDEHG